MALPTIAAGAAKVKKKKGEIVVTTAEFFLFALPLAGINDILDFGNFTGIWKMVTLGIDFATASLLWLWFLIRLRDKPGFKLRFIRFIITPLAEFVVGIGILPCWLILVTWEYLKGRVIK